MRGLRFAAWVVAGMSCAREAERSAPDPQQDDVADAAPGVTTNEPARDASARPADAARVDVAVEDARAQPDGGSGRDTGSSVPASDAAAAPACKTARFCDDFEAYAVGKRPASPWSVSTGGGGTLAVDGTRPFSGAKSVHIVAPAGTPNAWLHLGKPLLPLVDNVIYMRAMIYVNRTVAAHWNFVEATGSLPAGFAVYSSGGQGGKVSGFYYLAPHDCWDGGRVTYPTGRWVCQSWQIDGSRTATGTTKNEMLVSLDGTQVEHVIRFGGGCTDNTRTEWAAPTFQNLQIGWEVFQSSPAVEMWLDDVAVDSKPLPCPAP
jgi:hypothetical protein